MSMHNLSGFYYEDEIASVRRMLDFLPWDEKRASLISQQAAELIEQMRTAKRKGGELESFMQQFSLTSDEGLALMCLAEALLRIPDDRTANALIRDKIAAVNWLNAAGAEKDWAGGLMRMGLAMSRKTLEGALSRLGEPFIRRAMLQAIKVLGEQFVLGRTIDEALKNAAPFAQDGYRFSFDMLGEGARTQEDGERYFESYAHAIDKVATGRISGAGISVKLSALHPRYEFSQADRCVPVVAERLIALAQRAADKGLRLTVDAEEARRLELSLQVIERALFHPALKGWEGLGLAVQAYSKRALPLIDNLEDMARQRGTTLQVRLVKGAYWDSEIKRAQVQGLPDYPVFTRKTHTDLSYLACAHKLLVSRHIYPLFGTHNAHTVCAVVEMARDVSAEYQLQRLHGMGTGLYDLVMKRWPEVQVNVYAPVGNHRDLLPYLVRRLLENGANSSFVNRVMDKSAPAESLCGDPVAIIRSEELRRNSRIPLPESIYGPDRINSKGVDLIDEKTLESLQSEMQVFSLPREAAALIGGKLVRDGDRQEIRAPHKRSHLVGHVYMNASKQVTAAFETARSGFTKWGQTPAEERARTLEIMADLLEKNRAELMALCVNEAGKTLPDALGEIREAADFCRYYAARGRQDFSEAGRVLQGPTGERNVLSLHGRGVFVCISPWNFPLAIFTGQIAAALMAGNAVIAKPAEQTPLIALRAVQLFHQAGVPAEVLALLPGDGLLGDALVRHPDVAGVAFTGSNEAAWSINRALAEKRGPIVPFIAETGGQNAMIVDSSALLEQVIDDALLSAFGSAGQRCSALRVLYVQQDVADPLIAMLRGAMADVLIGDPFSIHSDVGPVIDEPAHAALMRHRGRLEGFGKLIAEAPMPEGLTAQGHYFAPCAYELPDMKGLQGEVFGPILHVIRYDARKIDEVLADIRASGYGLTCGVHSRIESFQNYVAGQVGAGNIYVNRSMIGAVVGVQPFGGQGLSGTGPKAGGPHYLARFAHERVVSTDTTASGGNASLVSLGE